MKKISFFSRKGGSGKTLCSLLVGGCLEQKYGNEGEVGVRYTDLDQQGTLREVNRFRGYQTPRKPHSEIVDYPPSLSGIKLETNLKDSDIIVIPSSLNPIDLMVVNQSINFLQEKSINLKRICVLLNLVKTNTREFKEKDDVLKQIQVDVLKNFLPSRSSFSRVPLEGIKSLNPDERELIFKVTSEIWFKNVPPKKRKDEWKWLKGNTWRRRTGYQYRGMSSNN